MKIIRSIDELRQWRKTAADVAFVPTMGNLHEGHLALVKAAKKAANHVVVSIFVNPIQFGQGEDYLSYPRTLDEDAEKLKPFDVDVIFAPTDQVLYPRVSQDYNIEPPAMQNELCGRFRPGHFRGVATVVAKLFHIVVPDVACFGKKDYQQLCVIQGMVEDLNIPVRIVPVDTGRAIDGLALSSRNAYLSEVEREKAPLLYQILQDMAQKLEQGVQDYAGLEAAAVRQLEEVGWSVDYIEVRRQHDLALPHMGDTQLIVLAAARLGRTRLIDNIEVTR